MLTRAGGWKFMLVGWWMGTKAVFRNCLRSQKIGFAKQNFDKLLSILQ